MAEQPQQLKNLSTALNDHSAEGIEILTSEPSRLFGLMLWLIAAMLLSAVLWSFIGKSPEIVSAQGAIRPDSEVRRFYAPIEGELVDIFVSEGQPVTEGDVMGRLNARGAVEAAARSLDAQIKLEAAERVYDHFPERKTLILRKAAALERQIKVEEKLHERKLAEGLTKLKQSQKAKLQEVLSTRDQARRALAVARKEKGKFERLLAGGGVSRDEVELKRSEYLSARANFRVAEAKLGELEFNLSQEDAQATAGMEESYQKMVQSRIELERLQEELANEENKLELDLRSARLTAEAASRVSFNHIDEENFLLIRASESGVITELTFTQAGDKVQANTPLGGIAPAEAVSVLEIQINESDRGLLRVGLPVKMKFNAFPFQRYGFIEGTLEYISPAAQPSSEKDSSPVFKGRVSLDRDFFEIDGREFKLRYGMLALAEIIVHQRRIIDLVLDPLKKAGG
jgi:HlyD family secretion protein